ncbi:MAG: efflux RND transporter periplasmic adaptor subunit [Elusimicrobiales bacterium]|nr:efflux RND transporter periplasmic adaptor subunit [Elusimicrobiales bacterium]
MKKLKSAALKIAIYAAACGLLGGGGWWGYRLYKGTSDIEAEIDKVSVSRGDIELKFQDIGDIAPKNLVEVMAKVGGRVEEVLVKEGDAVLRGQKLVVVQPGQSDADKFLPVDVSAPIDGTVMRCAGSGYNQEDSIVSIGQRVTGTADYGNATCLMQVADLSRMTVKLNVSEMEVLKLKRGMAVEVSVDALPELQLSGRIGMIAPKAEKDERSGVKSFRVEADIDQKSPRVRPGMTARIETVMEARKNVLKLPVAGLFEERGRKFAYLERPKARPVRTDLRVGLRNETEVEILGGLSEGATVYTDRPLNLDETAPAAGAEAKASGSGS